MMSMPENLLSQVDPVCSTSDVPLDEVPFHEPPLVEPSLEDNESTGPSSWRCSAPQARFIMDELTSLGLNPGVPHTHNKSHLLKNQSLFRLPPQPELQHIPL